MGCARDNFSQHDLLVCGHRSRTIRRWRCMIVSQCLEHRMHKKFYKVRKYELCRYGGTYVCTSLENPHAYIAEWTSYKTLGCINDPGSRPHSPQGMYVPLSDCSLRLFINGLMCTCCYFLNVIIASSATFLWLFMMRHRLQFL